MVCLAFLKIKTNILTDIKKVQDVKQLIKQYLGKKFIGRNGKEYKSSFQINNKARNLLLNNKLHNVSDLCCYYLKKLPAKEYEEKNK